MSVVANSSPLILFAKIGQLDLLRPLYGEVLIPPAVYREVVEQGAGRPGAAEIAAAPWIKLDDAGGSAGAELSQTLGTGEAEAIALAEARGLTVLIDDHSGRAAAAARGIAIVGSAGVLLAAKRRGLLATVRPSLDALVAAGLHLDTSLHRLVRELAGESVAE